MPVSSEVPVTDNAFKKPATAGWRDRGPEAETEEGDDDAEAEKRESEETGRVEALEQKISALIADAERGDLSALTPLNADLKATIHAFLANKRLDFKAQQWTLVAHQLQMKCRKLWKSGQELAKADAIAKNPSYNGPGGPIEISPEAAKAFEATNTTQFAQHLATFLGHSVPIVSQVMAVGLWALTAYKVLTLRSDSGDLNEAGDVLSTSAASKLVIVCSAAVARRQLRYEKQKLISKSLHLVTAFVDITGMLTPAIGAGTAAHSIYLNIRLTHYLRKHLDDTNTALTTAAGPDIDAFKHFPVLACFLTPPPDLLEQHSTSSEGRTRRAELALKEKGATMKLWLVQGLTGRAPAVLAEKYAQKHRALVLEDMKIADASLVDGEKFLPIPVKDWIGLPNEAALNDPAMIARFKAFIKLSEIAQHLREGYPIQLIGPEESGYEDKKDLTKRVVFGAL